MKNNFKYIYGPVISWRLGKSFGIDLLSQQDKICNFDCIYCQLGKTKTYFTERKIYIPVERVIEELGRVPEIQIDFITFSGRGEPSLAANLGEAIKAVKLIRKELVAVITNGSLMGLAEVRNELSSADLVVVKLDACSQESLKLINGPAEGLEFRRIFEGLKAFKESYPGKLALQMMFVDINKDNLNNLISCANYIKPDEIQINTPLRPCDADPLTKEEVLRIKSDFLSVCKETRVVSVFDERAFLDVASISDEDTLKRRGKVKA